MRKPTRIGGIFSRKRIREIALQQNKGGKVDAPHQGVEPDAKPQAHQHGGQQGVDDGGKHAVAVPAQKDIDIAVDKLGDGDVEAVKKVGHRPRLKGVVKVFGKPQPEKAAQPARHIAVAGQGIVQPEGGRDNQNPHRQHRTRGVFHLLNRLLDRQVPLCQNHQLGKNRRCTAASPCLRVSMPISACCHCFFKSEYCTTGPAGSLPKRW